MILFAATGITLNHSGDIEAAPVVTEREVSLPSDLVPAIADADVGTQKAPLPEPVARWLTEVLGAPVGKRDGEWSVDEIYVALPRPGGDAWISIDRQTGDVLYEHTDRGWISYLNDLHKGRNTGAVWMWFIDIFAVACLVFCITGLVLLKLHAVNRPATWPLAGLGLVAPLLIAILFIH